MHTNSYTRQMTDIIHPQNTKHDDLPTYDEVIQQPQPPAYNETPASVGRPDRTNEVYEDLDTVLGTTEFADVDEFDYEQLSAVVDGVSLDAGDWEAS